MLRMNILSRIASSGLIIGYKFNRQHWQSIIIEFRLSIRYFSSHHFFWFLMLVLQYVFLCLIYLIWFKKLF